MRRVVQEVLTIPDLSEEDIEYLYRQHSYLTGSEQFQATKRIVSAPNCPPKIYASLFPKAPDHALLNPAWLLFLIEGQYLRDLDRTFITSCLHSEKTSRVLLEALRSHPDAWVARAAALHVSLAGEAEPGWEKELLTDWTTRLLRDSSLVWLMRAGALPEPINRRLPYPIAPQTRLSETESLSVIRDVARQKGMSLATVLAIIQLPRANFEYQKLSLHPHWERRLAVALNPEISQELKLRLQRDGHTWVRAAARGSGGIL